MTKQLRIALLGYGGRMGQAIAAEIAASKDCVLAGGLVRAVAPEHKKVEGAFVTANADEVIAVGDVVIDFTLAEATPGYARLAAKHGKPFVSGVTGLGPEGLEVLKQAAARIPVLHAPNTSVSLVVMKQITELAAKLLGGFDYDIAILDEHHRRKKDAPSGTAKALGEAAMLGNGGKKMPAYASIRAGSIIGEHEVTFAGPGETIRLRHSITDRSIFAKGALDAARWLHGKPAGLYGMEDVVGYSTQICHD